MLLSLAIIFLLGMALGELAKICKLPPLLGMLIAGIIVSPNAANLLSGDLLAISADLRKIALIIILMRAGLNLDLSELKKVGRPAVLMCFLPATIEIIGTVIIAPIFLDISYIEAALFGAVLAAVSPAVIVPKMLKLIDEKQGTDKGIPQMIMAGASVDDVFVIVLFTSFLSLASGGEVSAISFARIPISIILGILVGAFVGVIISLFFSKFHIRDSVKIIILMAISFVLVTIDDKLTGIIAISGLIAVITTGIILRKRSFEASKRISTKFSKLWILAEIMLFVLVGATVDIGYIFDFGLQVFAVIIIVLLFRMTGVFLCLLRTKLTIKERIFTMIAYCPKATVQAAIGAIPLSAALGCGEIILTGAVVAILFTAPVGAFAIEHSYKKLTQKAVK